MTPLLLQFVSLAADNGLGGLFPIISTVLVVMLVFMMLTGKSRQKRDQEARDRMLKDLARNDRVVTLGGVVGIVADIRDDEVTIKVDESNNTRVKLKKWGIRSVVPREGEGVKESK